MWAAVCEFDSVSSSIQQWTTSSLKEKYIRWSQNFHQYDAKEGKTKTDGKLIVANFSLFLVACHSCCVVEHV